MIDRLAEVRNRQARIINGVLREGVRPRNQLADNKDLVLSAVPLDEGEHLTDYIEAVVIYRAGILFTKKEQDRNIRESLCSRETPGFSLFPIVTEREYDYLPWSVPEKLLRVKRDSHQARAKASCLIVTRLEPSDLGRLEEYGAEGRDIYVVEISGGIAPERIGAVVVPEPTLNEIDDIVVNPHAVSVLSAPMRRQKFLYGMLTMPDYRTTLKKAVNEIVGSSLVHIVRLPTVEDIEEERLASIAP